jgi:hypothetical protein
MTDIIADIDALIDDQLDAGEPRTGYDYGDPKFPKCWHCGRAWHGLPVTERIAQMYDSGLFDEDYRASADDSRVLCHGSEFIGPMPRPASTQVLVWPPILPGDEGSVIVFCPSCRNPVRIQFQGEQTCCNMIFWAGV